MSLLIPKKGKRGNNQGMEIHLTQVQVDQLSGALWGIAHAFEYVASALIAAAVIRGFMNK